MESLRIGQVTGEWLARHLPQHAAGAVIRAVEPVGRGQGLLGELYRVVTDSNSFVFKLPPAASPNWDALGPLLRAFERETGTYGWLEDQRGRVGAVVPRCYWAAHAADGRGALVLEDLTRQQARPCPPLPGPGLGQLRAALQALATVHAAFARVRPPGTGGRAPQPWLYDYASPALPEVLALGLRQTQAIREQQLPGLLPHLSAAQLADWPVAAQVQHCHRASTLLSLCHGDVWTGNVLFADADGQARAWLIDWQFTTWGNPLVDVAFLLASALAPARRRRHTAALLRHYHARLLQAGLSSAHYSFAQCWQDYQAAWPYGVIMTLANLEAFLGTGLTAGQLRALQVRLAALVSEAGPRPGR